MHRPVVMRDPVSTAPKSSLRRQLLLFGLASCITMPAAFARGGGRAGSFPGIDLEEAKRAAAQRFERLDRCQRGKLTRAQLGWRRVTADEFSWADRDHDGTIDKDEFLALVERQFRAADVDNDGTVSRAEFGARSGLPFRRLVH